MDKRIFCLIMTIVFCLTGCSGSINTMTENIQQQETAPDIAGLESAQKEEQTIVYTGEISFEIPVSTLNIFVNPNGYQAERGKQVIFKPENLSGEFRVIREADWEVIYTGTIEKNVGDFSDVSEPGEYFIEQDEVGRSYTFSILEDTYEPIFQGLMQNLIVEIPKADVDKSDICDVSFGMHAMMLTLQCHGVLFEKDNNLVSQILEMAEWLLTFQDEKTGSMFDDYEATAAFCGVLAQSADSFGKYDAVVSKQFMEASKKAWKWLEKQSKQAKECPSAQFYAATQLMKAEESVRYKEIVDNFLKTRETKLTDDKFSFYGALIYLNTVKNIDRDLCTQMMQEMVSETEEISQRVKENPYFVYTDNIDENFQKILLIGFVDYITPSNEYAVILENTLHYLLGRNQTGSGYLKNDGTWIEVEATVQKNVEWNGILLFCLSDLLNDAADDIK